MKKQILRIKREGDENWVLCYNDEDEISDPHAEVDWMYQPTLEELADFMDQNAEDENHHDMVGKHRALAAFLYSMLGRIRATEVFYMLGLYGGLDMFGPEDFGLKNAWNAWKLEG